MSTKTRNHRKDKSAVTSTGTVSLVLSTQKKGSAKSTGRKMQALSVTGKCLCKRTPSAPAETPAQLMAYAAHAFGGAPIFLVKTSVTEPPPGKRSFIICRPRWSMIFVDITEEKQTQAALKKAMKNVQTLRGIIPICASCKDIKDAEGLEHIGKIYPGSFTGPIQPWHVPNMHEKTLSRNLQ